MFGLRWQAMVQGLAFMSHQLGSFLGAYGGGVLYDALGILDDLAWRLGVVPGTLVFLAGVRRLSRRWRCRVPPLNQARLRPSEHDDAISV